MRMVAIIVAVLVLFTLLWGYVSSGILIDQNPEALTVYPQNFGAASEDFSVQTADHVMIKGWFVPSAKKSDSTIIVLHGWGSNRSDMVERSIRLAQNYNLIYFDFRNHGESGKAQTSLTFFELKDLDAVLKYLKENRPAESARLGVLGCSMGAGIAITGAALHPEILAIAAESSFTSVNATVRRYAKRFYHTPEFFVPITLWFLHRRLHCDPETYSPIHFVEKLSPRPILLIQSDSDRRMPVTEGQTLFAAAKNPKELWTVPNADHGYIHKAAPQEYDRRIAEFFQTWIPQPSSSKK